MKKITILLIAFLTIGIVSCDKFLDRQEDEQLTEEKIWKSYDYTRQYFLNCMGYLPNDAENMVSGVPYFGATDEASMTWNYNYRLINFGSWNATSVPNDRFNTYYQGIRDCNIFLNKAPDCSDPILSTDNSRKAQLEMWLASVRFARAYLYFLLMRDYGPVFLVGDTPMDFTASTAELQRPRDTWDACVDYVTSEMQYCADNLPDTQSAAYYGLPTVGSALAVISRLKLYSARDLFNGNKLYRTVRNPDGTALFPEQFDANKWVEAAQAAKDVIDLGLYELYTDKDDPDNAYLNYYGVFQENWNKELIYCGGGYRHRGTVSYHTMPVGIASYVYAYGGWGPTQSSVDSYAMANGRYPITGYDANGGPIVDSESGYPSADQEFKTTEIKNPFLVALKCKDEDDTKSNSPRMYANREPRFYVTVYWPGTGWKHGDVVGRAIFADGAVGHTNHDYPVTGYLVNKWVDHQVDNYSGQYTYMTFPTFRYAEIILNYVEAVIECEINGVSSAAVNHGEAMNLWASLRKRSGLPPITDVYENLTNEQLREYIRRERQVELAQEGHRYFDTRTWMIAPQVCNGPVYGLDTSVKGDTQMKEPPAAMLTRKVVETRVFKSNHYLYPFLQRELDRNKVLTQNYGW